MATQSHSELRYIYLFSLDKNCVCAYRKLVIGDLNICRLEYLNMQYGFMDNNWNSLSNVASA